MKKYVGCRVERDREASWIRLTQPVKIQKSVDEYGIDIVSNRIPSTPAEPGSVLKKDGIDEDDLTLPPEEQFRYMSATAVLLHAMRWSRPEVMNAVRTRLLSLHAVSETVSQQGTQSNYDVLCGHPSARLIIDANRDVGRQCRIPIHNQWIE
jgi:hypothetical protein